MQCKMLHSVRLYTMVGRIMRMFAYIARKSFAGNDLQPRRRGSFIFREFGVRLARKTRGGP